MRLRNIQARVAGLEKLLGHRVHQFSSELDRKVAIWLFQNEEYRNLARQIFERGCELDGQVTEESFERIVTADERARFQKLTREAEDAVGTGLPS